MEYPHWNLHATSISRKRVQSTFRKLRPTTFLDGQFRVTLEWNGFAGVDLGAVAIVGRANFAIHFGSSHFGSNGVLSRTVEGVAQCHAGKVFSPNPFRLARCGSRATSAVRTVAEASAAALFEAVAWLVASSFGVMGHTNSPEVASRQCASSQSSQSEGSSAYSCRGWRPRWPHWARQTPWRLGGCSWP